MVFNHSNNVLSCDNSKCDYGYLHEDDDRTVALTHLPPEDSDCEYYNIREPFDLTHLDCAICKQGHYVDEKGEWQDRHNTDNCVEPYPYDSDTCL